jgi:AcrR family transcriptional regulator
MLKSSVDGVRVDRLAKDLKVTRGSFYWHFRDRAALLDAVLQRWEQISLDYDQLLLSEAPDPDARLLRYLQLPEDVRTAQPSGDIEMAIRVWARRSAEVRRVARRVDARRERMVVDIFHGLGVGDTHAGTLARLCMAIAARLWLERTGTPRQRREFVTEAYAMLMREVREVLAPAAVGSAQSGARHA